jgi:hypothetical protein
MNFSKNSWHFLFAHKYGGLSLWDDEPVRTSLCEYVKRVALGLFLFCLVWSVASFMTIFGIGGFIALFTYGVYQWQFFGPFTGASGVILTVVAVVGPFAAISWYCERDSRRMNKEWKAYSNANPDADYWDWRRSYSKQFTKNPSIIKEWFKAKKEKVCPIITIE